MPAGEVVDRDALERLYGLAAHPIAGRVGTLRERRLGHAVEVEPRRADTLEPAILDDVAADAAVATERSVDVGVRRALPRPERAARAIPREPVERQVARVDRPDERLVRDGGLRAVRREPRERRVLAHVPEHVRPLAAIRRCRRAHLGTS